MSLRLQILRDDFFSSAKRITLTIASEIHVKKIDICHVRSTCFFKHHIMFERTSAPAFGSKQLHNWNLLLDSVITTDTMTLYYLVTGHLELFMLYCLGTCLKWPPGFVWGPGRDPMEFWLWKCFSNTVSCTELLFWVYRSLIVYTFRDIF